MSELVKEDEVTGLGLSVVWHSPGGVFASFPLYLTALFIIFGKHVCITGTNLITFIRHKW